MIPKKILFILHETTESGAPYVIYNFMLWLKDSTAVEFDALILSKGNLFGKFASVCSEIFVAPQSNELRVREKIKRLLTNKRESHYTSFFSQLKNKNYDLIYVNSIFSLSALEKIKHYYVDTKKVLHVHEAEFLSKLYFGDNNPSDILKTVDKVIAVSEVAKNNLITKYNFPAHKIEICHPYLNPNIKILKDFDSAKFKRELGIHDDDFVLGSIGNPHLIKGTELFPMIASLIKKKHPDFKFKILIIGGNTNNLYSISGKIDAEKLGVENNLIYLNHQSEVENYLKIFDLYALTSREESFSLMAIKASLCTIPIITFRNNGGPNEILSEETAFFVDYLDLNSLSEKIYNLHSNKILLREKAEKAQGKFEKKFRLNDSNSAIWKIICT